LKSSHGPRALALSLSLEFTVSNSWVNSVQLLITIII
jgi:hypothetical protein